VTRSFAGHAVRLPAYAVAVAASGLLTATLSQSRLVAFDSPAAALGFGLALGLVLAGIAPGLERLTAPVGCVSFAVAALAVSVLAFALVGSWLPGFRATFAGALVGGTLATLAAGAVFSLFDEGSEEAGPDADG
jgi:uncharacterized membrane protein YvlD (DUF360 family)